MFCLLDEAGIKESEKEELAKHANAQDESVMNFPTYVERYIQTEKPKVNRNGREEVEKGIWIVEEQKINREEDASEEAT